ncbi:MAG: CHRD domain-containing protein, partial [Emticicia sp.]|uniref:CHRD domain-containing protein n=1 Tax=Emticicia sp. TaxID=1930953 RepID=UPI003BA83465
MTLGISTSFGQANFTGSYSQNFNGLPSSGTTNAWTNNTTLTGWYAERISGTGTTALTLNANDGSSNAGGIHSLGATGNSERAFGSLASATTIPAIGLRLTNATGNTITNLRLEYVGEIWRTSTSAQNKLVFSYQIFSTGGFTGSLSAGTWTPVTALDFTGSAPVTTNGAVDGNLAANQVAISNTISSINLLNGQEIVFRWVDANEAGNDASLGIDNLVVSIPSTTPVLSINDISQTEGNSGTTNFTFTVSLSSPARAGGVSFDISTADNTATTANNDYISKTLTGQIIPENSSTYSFTTVINGDLTPETNETFFVNITNVVGATVGDGQGQGTINNDDVAITPIHDIQGPGNSSPIVGSSITTRGIVTGVKSNGFFIQEPDASVDADPATSEGILVFTSSAPPVAATIGNLVQVTGTVTEFIPSQDPLSPPITEITSPTVIQLSAGNSLPSSISLTTSFPSPSGAYDQLERYEGMRVSVSSMTVVAPTQGSVSESNATSLSNGVFYGVVTGNARPFREAGILDPNPAPSGGSIPPIPRYDGNPELIRVDSDSQPGSIALDVSTGTVLTNLIGPLDYSFRYYTILPDAASPFTASGPAQPTGVSTKESNQFTVGTFNLQRFYDTIDDPGTSDVILTNTAFNNRLNKASLAIRNILKFPDILAVVEMEKLSVLQTLATKISNDAIANSQPDPQYSAYLIEGNDVGGIDVGFLVKGGGTVSVTEVVQESGTTLFINPDASTEILNDRPPLRLKAVINHTSGKTFPITVIVNHLRSLNGVDSETPGSNGWATSGARVRAKRQKQAENLANLIQSIQTSNPDEKIVLVGDFNAFEFNDGLVDMIGVIKGTPSPDNQTAVPGDGVDLVNPNFVSPTITDSPYSYTFDGSAQTLDHVIVSANLNSFVAKVEHGRINADFPEIERNNPNSALRISDHDPVVATINFCPPSNTYIPTAVSVDKTLVCPGANVSLTATCTTGTVTWYTDATGGVAIGTGSPFSHSPSANTTYYAACMDFICESNRVSTDEVTPVQLEAPTGVSNRSICTGSSATLTASCTSGNVAWYGSETTALLSTVSPYATPQLTENTSYSVRCENNGCFSDFVNVSVSVVGLPNSPSTTTAINICSSSRTTLRASCSSGTVFWYNNSSADGTGRDGDELTTAILTNTTSNPVIYSFWVRCETTCKSPLVQVDITVNPELTAPTVTPPPNVVVCSPTSLDLSATCTVGTVLWSDNSTGTSLRVNTVGTYSISAKCVFNGCESLSSTTLDLEIKEKPAPPTIEANQVVACSPNTLILTATGCEGTVVWSEGAASGTSLTLSTVGTYAISATCIVNGCISDPSTILSLEIKQTPPAPSLKLITDPVVCQPSTIILSASDCIGTITWSIGGATGTSLTLSAVGTYSVTATCTVNGCTSPASIAVSGLTINAEPIVAASANQAICIGSNASLAATCNLYTLSANLTGTQEFPSNNSTASGSLLGTFNTVTNQISLNVSYANLSGIITGAHLHNAPANTNGAVIVDLMALGSPTSISGNYINSVAFPSAQAANLLAGNIYLNIHNSTYPGGEIRGQIMATCAANSYLWNPGALSGAAVSVSPATTTVYTVTASNSATGCSATATTQVFVNPLPTPTASSNSPQCAGNTLNLNASGGVSYAWTGPNAFSATIQNPSVNNASVANSG